MLYETPGEPADQPPTRFPFVWTPFRSPSRPGLGAIVPHSSNIKGSYSGGGGGGQGGQGGGGGAPIAPLVGNNARTGFRPNDNTTQAFSPGKNGKRSSRFRPSGIASRSSTPGDSFQRRQQYYSGLGGLGSWFSHWTNVHTYLPPGGKLNRITPIPASIRRAVPSFIRRPIRYFGAGFQTIFASLLTGSQQRRFFGLSARESRVFMKGQQVFRIVDAAVLAAYGGYAYFGAASAEVPVNGALPTSAVWQGPLLPGQAVMGPLPAAASAIPASSSVTAQAMYASEFGTSTPAQAAAAQAAVAPVAVGAAAAPAVAVTPVAGSGVLGSVASFAALRLLTPGQAAAQVGQPGQPGQAAQPGQPGQPGQVMSGGGGGGVDPGSLPAAIQAAQADAASPSFIVGGTVLAVAAIVYFRGHR